ncbi:hypothetical protein GCM10009751_09800 [Myceligenerans crystallogenes]|uniref:Extracellular solute-binding protein n=1 Tax=Myceligenerans crystallogenes TaxID=316335 RepID=A0ABN2N7C3_9MICO
MAGLVLAAVLVVGIVVAIVIGRGLAGGSGPGEGGDLRVVTGVIGSEKEPFFDDPRVKAAFARHGLDVRVTTAGSRQIATSVDLAGVDFVSPGSAPARDKLVEETGAETSHDPFYTPMALASWRPIAELLRDAGVAKESDGRWTLDMERYLELVADDTRWEDLEGAAEAYPSSRSILVSSTDVRTSNSAAMYLAIASYVANGDSVVGGAEQDEVLDELAPLFLEQGYSADSSESPFEDYLSQGIGSKPLVMIYEAQFLGRQLDEATAAAITDDMLLMYPEPTILSRHAFVTLTDAGDEIGTLLESDPELTRLVAAHGFRPNDAAVFTAVLEEAGVEAPPAPVDVVEPPAYETLESMIAEIEQQYDTPTPTQHPTADQ